jgi:hypothetical protein
LQHRPFGSGSVSILNELRVLACCSAAVPTLGYA